MTLSVNPLMNALVDACLTLGRFESVNKHEPKAPHPGGYMAAMWVQSITPLKGEGGLESTTVRAEFTLRIYGNMLQEPQDEIDPEISDAAELVMSTLSGDFSLGGLAREVDLLGAYGTPLGARAGYIVLSGKLFRVMDVTVPVIVDNVWTQVA